MPRKPNLELIGNEAPEASTEWFAKARPASEVLPELFADSAAKDMLQPKSGQSVLASSEVPVNIHSDATRSPAA